MIGISIPLLGQQLAALEHITAISLRGLAVAQFRLAEVDTALALVQPGLAAVQCVIARITRHP